MCYLTIVGLEQPDIQCDSGDTVLMAALRGGVGFPYECASGGCGACKYELLDGKVSSIWPEAPGLSPRDRQKGNRYLACQSSPLTNLRVKVPTDVKYAPLVPVQRREAIVVDRKNLTHDLMSLKLATEAPAEFLPGQFCLLESVDLPGVARAYSMANLKNREGVWEFYIKRAPAGRFTSWLFEKARVGVRLTLDGPLGTSVYRPSTGRKILCIGGGAGLSYATAIAKADRNTNPEASVTLFYGARSNRDIVNLADIGLSGENVNVVQALSASSCGTWRGPTGYIHDVVDQRLADTLSEYEIYLAGPSPMIDATMRMLLSKGVSRDQIHFDAFF